MLPLPIPGRAGYLPQLSELDGCNNEELVIELAKPIPKKRGLKPKMTV
jgi:hypothetical protein